MNAPGSLVYGLREQIANRIRNDVLCGRLIEGQRLSELKLVEQFGVSRTPIREALQQLLHEGILEGRPNAGLRVASHPPDAIRELIVPIRRTVETFALRSYFSQLDAGDFAEWNAILERLRAACLSRDYASIAEHDIEFHRSIVRRAHQRDLDAIWMSLVARVRSHFLEAQRPTYEDPIEIYDEHVQIVEVFARGDVEAAVAILEEKIN